MTTATLQLNAARLHYEVGGQGKPLALVHSAGGTMHMWDPQWGPLTRSHRLLRYDLRRHGESTWDPDTPYFADEDLVALMDAVGFSRATLVGAGYGGTVAVELALTHPDRVAGLVLVSPRAGDRGALVNALRVASDLYSVMFRGAMGLSNSGGERLKEAIASGDVEALVDFASAYPGTGTTTRYPEARRAVRAMMRQNAYFPDGSKSLDRWHTKYVTPRLWRTTIPCLTVVGEAETPLLVGWSRAVARSIRHGETVVEPNNTQWMNLEEPERFTNIVLNWLAAHDL